MWSVVDMVEFHTSFPPPLLQVFPPAFYEVSAQPWICMSRINTFLWKEWCGPGKKKLKSSDNHLIAKIYTGVMWLSEEDSHFILWITHQRKVFILVKQVYCMCYINTHTPLLHLGTSIIPFRLMAYEHAHCVITLLFEGWKLNAHFICLALSAVWISEMATKTVWSNWWGGLCVVCTENTSLHSIVTI